MTWDLEVAQTQGRVTDGVQAGRVSGTDGGTLAHHAERSAQLGRLIVDQRGCEVCRVHPAESAVEIGCIQLAIRGVASRGIADDDPHARSFDRVHLRELRCQIARHGSEQLAGQFVLGAGDSNIIGDINCDRPEPKLSVVPLLIGLRPQRTWRQAAPQAREQWIYAYSAASRGSQTCDKDPIRGIAH